MMRSDQSKIFIKDKTKVACRMSGIERRDVYFRKLLFKTILDMVSVIVSTDRTDNWVISRLLSVSIFRTVEKSSRRLCQHSPC